MTVSLVFAFAVALLSCRILLGRFLVDRIVDVPNPRSLHVDPTPRTGGLAITAGVAAGLGVFVWVQAVAVGVDAVLALVAIALVWSVSLLDDWRGVSPAARIGVHLLACGLIFAQGAPRVLTLVGDVEISLPGPVGWALAVLFCVWMINLYNFMDGMDGFASGMAVIGFGTLGVLFWGGGEAGLARVAWVVSAAAAGFHWFNFPPARIFMGDVGAAPLGLVAGLLILEGVGRQVFPLAAGILAFGPFIADATITVFRRSTRGERVWVAHLSHGYQRLVRSGWSHSKTLGYEVGLMVVSAGLGLGVAWAPPTWQLPIVGLATIVYGAVFLLVERRCGYP